MHKPSVRCAVVGNPVAHSLSPQIHQHFAAQAGLSLAYEKIQGDNQHFESQVWAFFNKGGRGLNITLPFKTRAFAMARVLTPRCALAKAANTLWMEAGLLHADNTDGIGLIRDLVRYIDLTNKKILLLGAGGAARGVLGPLLAASIKELTLVNRTMEKAHALANDFPQIICCSLEELHKPFDAIINATSTGLTDDEVTLPLALLQKNTLCYDLAYSSGKTPFVHFALKQGCIAVDGLGMLVEQAAEAFAIWHGFTPETSEVLKYLRHLNDR
jgi:shikimate dehydrogenase